MLKNLKIIKLNNHSKNFYNLMGASFGSRFIEKQIGLKVYDDENKEWVIALLDSKLVGFCSLQVRTVSDCFVFPHYRGNGIFDAMLNDLINLDKSYRAVCTNMSVRAFLKRNFLIKKKTKNFYFVEKINA